LQQEFSKPPKNAFVAFKLIDLLKAVDRAESVTALTRTPTGPVRDHVITTPIPNPFFTGPILAGVAQSVAVAFYPTPDGAEAPAGTHGRANGLWPSTILVSVDDVRDPVGQVPPGLRNHLTGRKDIREGPSIPGVCRCLSSDPEPGGVATRETRCLSQTVTVGVPTCLSTQVARKHLTGEEDVINLLCATRAAAVAIVIVAIITLFISIVV
tara:strand:+ start:396 stop:1028 length:633 start_codon:yes stop_codon:yes gene_type:complete